MPTLAFFEALLAEPVVQALGYVLLHTVWQGALVALVLWSVLQGVEDRPTARYAAACVALVLMLILPVLTGLLLTDSSLTP